MASPLVIVESQAKKKTLAAQFGSDAEFVVVSSPPMKISFEDEQGDATSGTTTFNFSPLPQEKELIEALQAGRDRDVYVALAHDQQGQYLAWMIDGYFSKLTEGKNTLRSLQILGLRQEDINAAIDQAGPVDTAAGAACYTRLLFHTAFVGHVQRLIGTYNGPGNLPISYNSLTVLFLLVERDEEIRTYSPAMKWQVQVDLKGPGDIFRAKLIKAPGSTEDGFFKEAAQGKEAVNKFKDLLFEVSNIERETVEIAPPAPFRLCDLLGDAAVRFDMQPKDVLMAVRQLFYGVEVDGVLTGLITSFFPQAEGSLDILKEKLHAQAEKEFGADLVADDVESFTDYAGLLLPLAPEISEKDLAGSLSEECLQIYGLIRARALASQMVAAHEESIQVELTAGPDCRFRADGRVLGEKGFMAIYQELADRDLLNPCLLSDLATGQTVSLEKIIPEQTRGYPPEYYTFDSLFDELVDFTIELDPSAVLMMQTMLDSGYLAIGSLGELKTGGNANKVASAMFRAFPSMRGINLSAYLEQTIEEAVSGRKGLGFAMRQFHQTLTMQGKALSKGGDDIASRLKNRKQTSSRIIATPQVEKPTKPVETPITRDEPEVSAAPEVPVDTIAEGSPPSQVPEQVEPIVEELEAAQVTEETSQGEREAEEAPPTEISEPPMDNSDAAAVFEESEPPPSESIPQETAAEAEAVVVPPQEGESSGMQCPVCQKVNIINKRTPTGRDFYVCPSNECEFLAWAKPHAVTCQVCHSPFLVEKRNIRGQSLLRCPRAGCNYMEPMDGGEIDTSSPMQGKKRLVRRVKKGGKKSSGGKRRVVVRRK